MNNDRVKVLLITGFGRSGSTLLAKTLGQTPGFFSVGELRFAWKKNFVEDQLCGCGRPFSECPFWVEVVERAYGRLGWSDRIELVNAKQRADRMRHIPHMASHIKATSYRKDLAHYLDNVQRLYRMVSEVSGANVVVDSSGGPSYAYALSNAPGLDLRTVHLVRDSRAVAYSWQRKKVKYETVDGEEYMDMHSPSTSAISWSRSNLLIEPLRVLASKYIAVRYEDLMADPTKTIGKVLALVDEESSPLPLIGGSSLELGENHIIAGNPNRFKRGKIELRLDDEWRDKMGTSDRRKVTALTWPLLLRYKYLV